MIDQFDLDTKWQFARQALSLMKRFECTPTPDHFLLWYEYSRAQNNELNASVNELISDGKAVKDEDIRLIFAKFFGNDALLNQVEGTSDDISSMLEQVSSYVNNALDSNQHFGETLNSATVTFSEGNQEEILKIVKTLTKETSEIINRNKTLETQLADTKSAIHKMNADLEIARQDATTDALTGIGNRKAFDTQIAKIIKESGGKTPALAMADVDHFKKFNDTHGHRTGDQVLILVARILSQYTDAPAIPLRYGGEEFAILFPDTSEKGAFETAELIRNKCAAVELMREDSKDVLGTVTMSLGLTMYRKGETSATFISRADENLYAAKNSGRNRTICDKYSTYPLAQHIAS